MLPLLAFGILKQYKNNIMSMCFLLFCCYTRYITWEIKCRFWTTKIFADVSEQAITRQRPGWARLCAACHCVWPKAGVRCSSTWPISPHARSVPSTWRRSGSRYTPIAGWGECISVISYTPARRCPTISICLRRRRSARSPKRVR